MAVSISGMSSRGSIANMPETPVQLETQDFLRFIASLVQLSKGMRIDLTVATMEADNEEFCRKRKKMLELARTLGNRPRRNEEV